MTEVLRELPALEPHRNRLQAEEDFRKEMEIICQPHPERPGQVLRFGRDKHGRWWKFEQHGRNDWHTYGGKPCSNTEMSAVVALGEEKVYLITGPAGFQILYHEKEPWGGEVTPPP